MNTSAGRAVRLADALEQVGCDDPAALFRLSGSGSFALGDWMLDGLLGKG